MSRLRFLVTNSSGGSNPSSSGSWCCNSKMDTMKKVILIFFLCFISHYSLAQNCRYFLGLEVVESDSLVAEPSILLLCKIDSSEYVVVIAKGSCSNFNQIQVLKQTTSLVINGMTIRSNQYPLRIDRSTILIPAFAKFYSVECDEVDGG